MLAPWMPVSTPHGDIVVSDLHKPQQLLSHSGETHNLIDLSPQTIHPGEPLVFLNTAHAGTLSSTLDQGWHVGMSTTVDNADTLNQILTFTKNNLSLEGISSNNDLFREELFSHITPERLRSMGEPGSVFQVDISDTDVLFPGASPVQSMGIYSINDDDFAENPSMKHVDVIDDINALSYTRALFRLPLVGIILGYQDNVYDPLTLNFSAETAIYDFADTIVHAHGGTLSEGDLPGTTRICGLDHIIYPVMSFFGQGSKEERLGKYIAAVETMNPFTIFLNLHLLIGVALHGYFDENGNIQPVSQDGYVRVMWPMLSHKRYSPTIQRVLERVVDDQPHINVMGDRIFLEKMDTHSVDQFPPDHPLPFGTYYALGVMAAHGVDIVKAAREHRPSITFAAANASAAYTLHSCGVPAFYIGDYHGAALITVILTPALVTSVIGSHLDYRKAHADFALGLLYGNVYSTAGDEGGLPYCLFATCGETTRLVNTLLASGDWLSATSSRLIHKQDIGGNVTLFGYALSTTTVMCAQSALAINTLFSLERPTSGQMVDGDGNIVIDAAQTFGHDGIPPLFFRAAFLYASPSTQSCQHATTFSTNDDGEPLAILLGRRPFFRYDALLRIMSGEYSYTPLGDVYPVVVSTTQSALTIHIMRQHKLTPYLSVAPAFTHELPTFDDELIHDCISRIMEGDASVFATIGTMSVIDKTSIAMGLPHDNRTVSVPISVWVNTCTLFVECGLGILSSTCQGDMGMLTYSLSGELGTMVTSSAINQSSSTTQSYQIILDNNDSDILVRNVRAVKP